jgi:ABC-type amino acid transport system permease subunit
MEIHTLLERASLGDDENRGPRLLITGITLMVIAVLVLSGRIYCRAVLLRRMGSDDWCMILATVCIDVAQNVGKLILILLLFVGKIVAIPILVTNCIGEK